VAASQPRLGVHAHRPPVVGVRQINTKRGDTFMAATAYDIIWPSDRQIVLRAVLLHVGQGSSTIILAREGASYRIALLDINLHEEGEGTDVPALMADLMKGKELAAFINSHPHNDHLCGVGRLAEAVTIREVWHSNHKPGKEDEGTYGELLDVVEKVTKKFGAEAERHLLGSDSPKTFGESFYYVLAPAKYVCEDIGSESEKDRRRRIHEQCAVLKFGYGDTWIMLAGDADRDAWENHIFGHHKDRLGAQILAAIHHGSRSFFKDSEEDEDVYLDALECIDPECVIVSAPKQEKSRHGHPHDDAMEIYRNRVGADNLLHTGENLHSFIVDIYDDGTYAVTDDGGALTEAYPYKADGSNDTGGSSSFPAILIPTAVPRTRIDQRPMGAR
jgi:beta-lactamase superfamily II metal-dependent hydrolase